MTDDMDRRVADLSPAFAHLVATGAVDPTYIRWTGDLTVTRPTDNPEAHYLWMQCDSSVDSPPIAPLYMQAGDVLCRAIADQTESTAAQGGTE